jgi:hypothetical protein
MAAAKGAGTVEDDRGLKSGQQIIQNEAVTLSETGAG